MSGIPAESFSAYKLRASNVDEKGQYFTTNVIFSNVVIANTLTKYTTI